MPTFRRLDVLPEAQRAPWPELDATPDHFTLYGGTALALRLGHRRSHDFGFFSRAAFDPIRLAGELPYLAGAETVQLAKDTLTCRVERGGPVLVSFFGALRLGEAAPCETPEGSKIRVASLLDIAGTKALAVQQRAQARDYVDIDALIRYGTDLPQVLAAGVAVYGRRFNPLLTLKALGYFDDVPVLPEDVRDRLRAAVAAVEPTRLPQLPRSRPPTIAGAPGESPSDHPRAAARGAPRRLVRGAGAGTRRPAAVSRPCHGFGTVEDLRALRGIVSKNDFREVLEHAPPGVFDARSWAYWNLVCGRSPAPPLPARFGPAAR